METPITKMGFEHTIPFFQVDHDQTVLGYMGSLSA